MKRYDLINHKFADQTERYDIEVVDDGKYVLFTDYSEQEDILERALDALARHHIRFKMYE